MQMIIKKEKNFIDEAYLHSLLSQKEDVGLIREIIAKSMEKKPLNVSECAVLLAANDKDVVEEIFNAAKELKKRVYGNRIVIFAPLYIGNHCINDCKYCSFRKSLRTTVRKTLNEEDIVSQVEALEDQGHKRLILVFGEHPLYTPQFIADTVRKVYSIKKGQGSIRRVNINAAPLDIEGYKTVKEAGIGTYQIFQETYHQKTYNEVHSKTTHKGDYLYRLNGLSRAFEGGVDDVGIGALFGLYDWHFEVLGLVSHANFLEKEYGCGPHTISFPRIRPAHGVSMNPANLVSDYDFKKLVAILRLSVPYTGMILTARETAEVRREVLEFGVSQIDAGTRIDMAGYTQDGPQELNKSQFQIGDLRSMDEIIRELLTHDYIPSFCTSCYRQGRTGEHFMEFAIPGFIEGFCTPNALFTLQEYLNDYASSGTKDEGKKLIEREIRKMPEGKRKEQIISQLKKIADNIERDKYF